MGWVARPPGFWRWVDCYSSRRYTSPQSGEDLQYLARSTRDLPMYALISKRGGEEP